MAVDKSDRKKRALTYVHPTLANLVKSEEKRPVVLVGYAATPPPAAGVNEAEAKKAAEAGPEILRIYASLDDLSSWYEVPSISIIDCVQGSKPLHPSTFFIESDAPIALHHTASEQARFVNGSLVSKYYTPATAPSAPASPGPTPPVYHFMTGICSGLRPPLGSPFGPVVPYGFTVIPAQCPPDKPFMTNSC